MLSGILYPKKIKQLQEKIAHLENHLEKLHKQKIIIEKEAYHNLQAVVESNLDAIILFNNMGEIILFNPAAEELFQYRSDEVLNQPAEILLRDGCQMTHKKRLDNFMQKGVGRCGHINARDEKIFRKKDGSLFSGLLSLSGARENGKLYIAATIVDVTEQKKAEEKIKSQYEQLRELNENKNMFLSVISHDLKSPLNTIIGFAELIYRKHKNLPKEKLQKFNTLILTSAKGMASLLDNLLQWSRLQQEQLVLKKEEINLYEIAHDNITFLSTNAENKKITVKNNIQSDLTACADKEMISAVIRNLLSNAIKFTDQDGHIHIEARRNHTQIVLSIKDDGIGMLPETANQLFSDNKQCSTSGTSGEKGTGLGLIICKNFVERNGGSIWAESTLGKGSVFYFTIEG
jgi:PAS domain S-box-containing protein